MKDYTAYDITRVGVYVVYRVEDEWLIEFPEPAGTLGGFKSKQEAIDWLQQPAEVESE